MQIKADFITNSSSTAYIVFVPNSYVLDEANLKTAIDMTNEITDTDFILTEEHTKTIIPEIIETLKFGETFDTEDFMLFSVCLQLFTIENFVVGGVDIAGDYFTCMCGIDQENILDVLKDHVDLDNLIKTLIKGANDERENKK